jgi:small subunit ribosomal protein S1
MGLPNDDPRPEQQSPDEQDDKAPRATDRSGDHMSDQENQQNSDFAQALAEYDQEAPAQAEASEAAPGEPQVPARVPEAAGSDEPPVAARSESPEAGGNEPPVTAAQDEAPAAEATAEGATGEQGNQATGEENKDFAQVLAEYEQTSPAQRENPAPGAKVSGRILSIGEESVFIDLGAKSEGMIPAAELRDAEGNLTVNVGDTIEATVTGTDPETGALTLRRKAGGKGGGKKAAEVHPEIRQAYENNLPIEGLVTGLNKGGAEIQVYGMRAFCPLSQLDLRYVPDPQQYVGQRLTFKVNRLEEGNRGGRGPNIVLSRRAYLEEEQQRRASETRDKLQVGAILTGRVTSLTTYGAFIDLGGIEGMLHVSEIGYARTSHPQDVFTIGQEVEVQVIKIEQGKDEKRPERISLSRRALERDPWRDVADRFPEGTVLTGRVMRQESFGAFVEIAPGIEGLVHISEMGAGRRLNHSREAVQLGQDVQVKVLGVDINRRRISLSMAAAQGGDDYRGGGGGGDRDRDRDQDSDDRGDRGRGRDRDRDRDEDVANYTRGQSSSGSGFGSLGDFFKRKDR